jgi:hypothetical protein
MALLALLLCFGACVGRLSMRNNFLRCSVGIVEVRTAIAWIYTDAEKSVGIKCHEE